LKVVSITPRACSRRPAVRQREVARLARHVLLHGTSAGTPGPWVKRFAHHVAGRLRAIMVTSTSGGGTTWLKWM